MFLDLFQNITLLVTLSVLYGILVRINISSTAFKVLSGILFGSMAIAGMNMPFEQSQGIIYDGRSIIMSLSGFFGGGISSVISMLIAGAYRAYLGGSGVWAGLSTVVSCTLIGLLFRKLHKNKPSENNFFILYMMGVAAHVVMLSCQLLLPWHKVLEVLSQIWFPVMLSFPLATLVIGLLMSSENRRIDAELETKRSRENYKNLIHLAPDAFFHGDRHGHFIDANDSAIKLSGYSKEELLSMNISELFDKETLEKTPLKYELLNQGQTLIFERYLKHKDGTKTPVEMISKKMPDGTYQAFFRNISERKASIEAIRQSEEKMRRIFKLAPVGIGLLKSEYITEINSSICDITRFEAEELINQKLSAFFANMNEYERVNHEIQKLSPNLDTVEIETTWKTKQNQLVNIMLAFSLLDTQDFSKGIIFIAVDISHIKRSELVQKIQYNIANAVVAVNSLSELFEIVRNELSQLMDTTNFVYAEYDEENDLLSTPFQMDEKKGIPRTWKAEKSLTGMVVKNLKSLLLTDTQIEKFANEGKIEYIGHRSKIWLGVPIKSGNKALGAIFLQSYNNPLAYQNTDKEILEIIAHELSIFIEKKKAELHSQKLLKAMTQSPASVVITDASGNIEYVNPKFEEITGFKLSEVLGKNPRILKSGLQNDDFYSHLCLTITAGKNWQGEMQNKRKDGQLYWEKVSISPLINENGSITHFVAVKEDITEHKYKEKLEREIEIAKRSSFIKQQFLANMSHEIRTPLNSILGIIEIMKIENISDQYKDELSILSQSVDLLLNIINDILDFSKIEAGKMPISIQIVDFKQLIQKMQAIYQPLAGRKSLQFFIKYPENIPLKIKTDEGRFMQIMTNLVSNAVKFTDFGSITIYFELDYLDDNQCKLLVEVRDTGIGISEEEQKILFSPFSQIDSSQTRKFEGTGLGLVISKQLIELMGGTIAVKSKKGSGSVFSFVLPVEYSNNEKETALIEDEEFPLEKINLGLSVLVAEDKKLNQQVISMMLRNAGCAVTIANNGVELLQIFHPNTYDIILMDIQMPEMDGISTTKILREKYSDLPPVIGVSANAMEGDAERFIAEGMDDYLSKPVRVKSLYDKLKQWMPNKK